jgi:hypothetical protein
MSFDNRLLFDYFYSIGLSETPKVIYQKIFSLDEPALLDFFSKSWTLVESDSSNASSAFDFVANSAMSAEPIPCSEIGCRLEKSERLSRLALMYSDKIRIRNPFEKYINRYATIFDEIARKDIANDIIILFDLKPLIENRIISFTSQQHHMCEECFYEIFKILPKTYKKRVNSLNENISDLYFKHTKIAVLEDQDDYGQLSFEFDKEGLYDHESFVLQSVGFKNKFKKVKNRKNKYFTEEEILKYEFFEMSFFKEYINDLLLQNWYSLVHHSNITSNRQLDIELINKLSSSKQKTVNKLLEDTLTHTLPMYNDIPISKLLELRTNEGEAFISYRNALDSELSNLKEYSNKELKQLYLDKIQPSIDQMRASVKSYKIANRKSMLRNVATAGITLTLGLYADFIPQGIANSILAMGAYHHGDKLLENILQTNKETEARKDKYFFLYKSSLNVV